MTINVHFILAAVACACGVLMLLGKRFGKWPLAAVAILCLAINELGIIR
jgi:hypothetical protein